jgi:molecular chaperone DnaK
VPQIEVTFDIDANGIVKVSAKDKATGKEQAISIKASGGLEEDEIDKMVKDAEIYAEDDKKRRETVETRNQAEALTHTAEKTLSDLGDNADEGLRSEVQAAIADVTAALEGEDDTLIKEKTEALSTVMMKLGEAAYSAEGDAEPASDQAAGETSDEVVDAEFEEIDDEDDDIKKAN